MTPFKWTAKIVWRIDSWSDCQYLNTQPSRY